MKTSIGLDIGSHSIKLIELVWETGKEPKLRAAGSMPTPPKALFSDVPADAEAVAHVIKELVRETGAKTQAVTLALPESKVFTRVIDVPELSSRELTSAIKWEAEQYIPLPLAEVNLDFTVLRTSAETGTKKMEVLLVAAPRALLDKYVNILELADLSPIAVETEIIATSRSLVHSVPNIKTVMVVSMGAQTTDIAIMHQGVLAFTRSVSAGGEALTRAISQSFDFTVAQAEEFKKTYGLQPDKLEGKIVTSTKPVMDMIVAEMKRAAAFYQEKYRDRHVEAILLSGGTSKLPGMIVHLAEAMGSEVQLADPWIGIQKDTRFAVLTPEGPNFAVAVGLALRANG